MIAEQALLKSPLETTIFRPSIVFDHSDPWITLLRRFSFLPAIPVSGDGNSRYQPIWADDVARAVLACLDGSGNGIKDLAGPETLSYSQMSSLVESLSGRPRPLLHVPLPVVHLGLSTLHAIFKEAVFATWQEAELMRVPMVSERGTKDIEELGVDPRSMADVLSHPA